MNEEIFLGKRLDGYLILMLVFQILILIVPVLPLNLDTDQILNFIVLADCGLIGCTVYQLIRVNKKNKVDKM